jgi:hypothetical protein
VMRDRIPPGTATGYCSMFSHSSMQVGAGAAFQYDTVETRRCSIANAPTSITIRVTHIHRRIDAEWYLVHRHADSPSDQRARYHGATGLGQRLMSAAISLRGGLYDFAQSDLP